MNLKFDSCVDMVLGYDKNTTSTDKVQSLKKSIQMCEQSIYY